MLSNSVVVNQFGNIGSAKFYGAAYKIQYKMDKLYSLLKLFTGLLNAAFMAW
jgi:hypothetical protein